MTEVADLYVVLRSVGGKFEEGMARAGASAERADGKIAALKASVRTMSLAFVGGGLLVAGEAVKMSSEFDRLMEQLHTLAHVPQKDIKPLSSAVLDLAGKVGFAPNSLAEALYHIESSFASVGITGPKAMAILTTASKGAQVGGADLVDVVNALDAAVVSGIPGVKNINQAMGALLATVGAGDMTMQNLAESLGTGILAVAKQYGATLADVGAGLAVFGDNNIRGSKAATDLRMAIMDLSMQSGRGAAVLKNTLGLQIGQLTHDMQSGGLRKALLDLHTHLDKVGITGTRVGEVLGEAFTKKSSAPLAILLGELNQFQSKYPELKKGAHGFGDAWKHTSQLIAQQAKDAKANIESAFIGLGHALAPVATFILHAFNGAFSWAKTHKKTLEEIAHVLSPVLYGALILVAAVLAEMAIEAAIAAAPFILVAAAVGFAAKALYDLYQHNAKFRDFVNKIVQWFKDEIPKAVKWLEGAFKEAKKIVGEVIQAIIGFYEDHKKAINKMIGDVVSVLKGIWQAFQAGFQAVVAIVKTVVKIVENLWERFGSHLWSHVVTAWNAIVQVVKGAVQVVKGIFEAITGLLTGHWSKFWKGICDIVDGAWNIVSGAVKGALNYISTLIGAGMAAISAVWGFLWHSIETMARAVWRGIEGVGHNIFVWFMWLPRTILGYLRNAWDWLYNTGKDLIQGLLNGISSAIHWLWQWATGLPGQIFNVLNGLYSWMLTVGKNIVIGIWNGIAGLASWLWNKVTSFCSDIWNSITSFFGISSPSRLMRDTVGKHIVTGIAQGIIENQHHVHNALRRLADDAAKTQFNVGNFSTGKYGPGGSIPGMGQGMVGSGNTVYHITVQGSVVDTAGLFTAVQKAAQQHGARNAKSAGLVFNR